MSRCASTHNSWLCDRDEDHPLPHRALLGNDRALRWGVVEIGCFDPDCKKPAGHVLPHNDRNGKSWWPMEDE